MTAPPLLEVCVESADGVAAAQDAGADRVELCAALSEGGLTPSLGTIRAALRVARIPVHVMVRPRDGDFVYSDAEFAAMREDVSAIVEAGAHAIVTGLLRPDGAVDETRTRSLVDLAAGRAVTFHRAFDFVPDFDAALRALARCGVRRVLTSGGRLTAREGAGVLADLVRRGDLAIVGCGRVRPDNVAELLRRTGLREIHFAPLRLARPVSPAPATPGALGQPHAETDPELIHAMRAALARG